MRKSFLCVMLVLVLLLSSSCSAIETVTETDSKQADDRIRIGMSFDSFVIERWQRDRDVFVSTAKEYGAEVNVQNANGDTNKQREQLEYFIKKGMDVIVIVCIDSDGLQETVQKARDAGIRIIAYDRLINNANVDLYITFDNEEVGTLMGNALIDSGLRGGNVLMLGGSPSDNNVPLVENGFRKVMTANSVTVLDSIHCDSWRAEVAAEYIYEHADIVARAGAIMCGNDNLATAVVHALAEKRLAGDMLVVGQDGDLEACQRIVEGTQVMTVYKPVEKLAQRAAECAIQLASGRPVKGDDVSEMSDGTFVIPYIGMQPIAVTEDNINEIIINSGFHFKEDVYLNVPDKMP